MREILAISIVCVALPNAPAATPQEQLREALLAVPWGLDWWEPTRELENSFESSAELVSCLISFLEDDHPRLRAAAADVLGRFASPGGSVTESLIHVSKNDEDAGARYMALNAVARILGADALNHLISALEDKSPLVRVGALGSIGRLGEAAADAVPAVTEALEDPENYYYTITPDMAGERPVRYKVAMSLGQIGAKASPALRHLRDILQNDPHGEVRCAVAFAIARIDADDSSGVRYLANVLKGDPTRFVLENALDRLGDLQNRAKPAMPAILQRLRNDKSGYIRLVCVSLLPKVNGTGKETISLLLAALDDPDPDVQGQVLETLEEMGKDASSAAPSVMEFLGNLLNEEPRETMILLDMRAAAVRTLLLIGDPHAGVGAFLQVLQADDSEDLRSDMLRVLEWPLPNADELVREFEESLGSADPAVHQTIHDAIARLIE